MRPESLTAEEFHIRYAGKNFELVRGRVVAEPPTGPIHGVIDNRLARRLGQQVEDLELGEVFSNTGFVLSRNPDVVRGPDQAFVSAEQLARHPMPQAGFWELVPALVVEVVSTGDSAETIAEKVADYVQAGVKMIWVLYPRLRQVHVVRPEGPTSVVSGDATLDGGDVLPGVRIPLAELWA